MAIEQVIEVAGARTGENDKGVAEYTRRFKVITSGYSVGAAEVRTATGIPRRFDVYATATETDNGSLCTRVSAEQDDENPILWVVSADYGSPTVDPDQASEPNPILRASVLSWSFAKSKKAVWRDTDNKPILNSALEYFDPPPECDDSRPILTISRNELAFNTSIAINYQDAVNSDPFLGFTAGQAKVSGITAQSQQEGAYRFWSVQYEFEFCRDGWLLQILDQGRTRIIAGERVPIYQRGEDGAPIKGLPVSDPVLLNGEGLEVTAPNPSKAKFLPYKVYKTLPFNALKLP